MHGDIDLFGMSISTRSPDMSDISEDATTVSSLRSASQTTSPVGGGPSTFQQDSKAIPRGRHPRSRRNRSVSSVPEILQQMRMSPWPPNPMLAPYPIQYTYATDADLTASSGHAGLTKSGADHFTLAPTIFLHNGAQGGGMQYLTWEYAPPAPSTHYPAHNRSHARNAYHHAHAHAHNHSYHQQYHQQQQQYRNAPISSGGQNGHNGHNGRKAQRRSFQQQIHYQPHYQNLDGREHNGSQRRTHQNRQYNQYNAGKGRYYEGSMRQSRSSSSLMNHGSKEASHGIPSLSDIRAAVSAALAGLGDSGRFPSSGDLHENPAVQQAHCQSYNQDKAVPGGALKVYPSNISSLNPNIVQSDLRDEGPDLERFLRAASPVVAHPGSPEGLAELSLSDLWKFYDHFSAFGLECTALGGPRGPSTCYFVPYLSAIHLFVPTSEDDVKEGLHYRHGLETWPSRLKKLYSWSAAEHVAHRMPLHDTLNRLTEGDTTHLLWSARFKDLHPYSWFAIAWYPLYRIPDAPLTARFLTFHSFAPLWEASVAAASAVECLHEQSKAPSARFVPLSAAQPPCLPATAGAVSYKMMLVKSGTEGSNASSTTGGSKGKGGGNGCGGTVTPRGVASFNPGSPFASDLCEQRGRGLYSNNGSSTNGTSGSAPVASLPSSRSQSLISMEQGASMDSTISGGSSRSSFPPSPAGSEAGDATAHSSATGTAVPPAVEPSEVTYHHCMSTSTENPVDEEAVGNKKVLQLMAEERIDTLSKREVDRRHQTVLPLPPLIVPVVGLTWHTAGSAAAENWTETLTLVSAEQPYMASSGNSLAGPSYTSLVVKKDYPLYKGGPLSWEIQLEELEEGAQRLALCRGLVKAGQRRHAEQETDEMESCCPDYDFFTSRRR